MNINTDLLKFNNTTYSMMITHSFSNGSRTDLVFTI